MDIFSSSNAQPITDTQRKALCEMMYAAFIDIRKLGWQKGSIEQAALLADAFHNVPVEMWESYFSLEVLRDSYLANYQEKYPEKSGRDWISMVNEIIGMRE